MGHSSYLQTSFLGGEWAPEIQGRTETDAYKTGLNKCSNYYPIEQGSLLRRQGFQLVGHTKAGAAGRVKGFDLTGSPLQLEFTNGWLRFILGPSFLANGVSDLVSISTATPAVVTTKAAHGYTTGDTVFFTLKSLHSISSTLFNRQFVATVTGASTFSIADALTGAAIDGSTIGWTAPVISGTYQVTRIAELVSPYIGGDWAGCTFVQDEASIIIFHNKYATRVITRVSTGFGFAIGLYTYADGPYLPINSTATTLTPSATNGTITVTASAITGINGGLGFQSTDVGRFIRMYNAPAAWDATKATYAVGDQVLYVDGNSYTAIKAGSHQTGVVPTNIDHWALLAFLPYWTWMKITVFTDTTHVTAVVQQSTSTTQAATFNILPTTNWRLGLYSTTTGWPTCGTYHEGRLWLAGVTVNRIDGSVSDLYGTFSPTGDDGTVGDGSAISGVVKANENNPIMWLAADDAGLLFGTTTSEWKIKASNLDDPLTPASSTPRRLTKWGSANIQPLAVHKMHLFVQRMQRKVIEFGHPGAEAGALYQAMEDANLSLTGSHLSVGGIAELAWTAEPKPIVWARRADGQLIGMTYLRDGQKLTAGWHQHPLGHGRIVESLSSGPSIDQLTDRLFLVTKDTTTNVRWIEMQTDVFDDNKLDYQGFFVDGGVVPPSAKVATVAVEGFSGVRAWGFWPLNGKTVSATFGGLDAGDAVVSNGVADFPFNAALGWTLAYLTSLGLQVGATLALIDATGIAGTSSYTDESGKLLCYNAPTGLVSGVTGVEALIDFTRGRVMAWKEGSATTVGLRVWPIDDHGTETLEVPRNTLLNSSSFPTNDDGYVLTPSTIDYLGNLYIQTGVNNRFFLSKIDAASLVRVGQISYQFPTNICFPQAMCPVKGAGNTLLLCGFKDVAVFSTDTFSAVPLLAAVVDEVRSNVCPGPQYSDTGVGYVIGHPNYNLGASAGAMGFYQVTTTVFSTVMTKVGTITPAQIDATWTNISNEFGMAWDQTDGNILMQVSTTDAVTNKYYIVKINATTAAIMWACPVNNIDIYSFTNMNRSYIANGKYCFMSPTLVGGLCRVYTVNTVTGTATFSDFNGITKSGGQWFDSRTGTITFFGSYINSAAPPTKIGDWFGVPNTTFTSQWARLGIIAPYASITSNPQQQLQIGTAIGTTFTSQAQLLRPDHGPDAGARTGPAFGKQRRNHWFAAFLNRTQNIKFGVDFAGTLHQAKLATKGGTAIAPSTLFSGILSDTIQDDYSFDGMISWQQTRPTPGQILAVGGYIQAQDK